MKRFVPSAMFYAGLLAFCLGIVTVPMACSGNQRQTTLHVSRVTLDAAKAAFIAWEPQHEIDLNIETQAKGQTKEEGKAKLLAFRAEREKVNAGFAVAYQALAMAWDQNDSPSLQTAAAEATKVLLALRTLGVPGV